jgi:hypothetical protein
MEAQAFWCRLQCDPTLCTCVDSVNPLPRRPLIHDSVGDLYSFRHVPGTCIYRMPLVLSTGIRNMLFAPTGACNLADHPMAPRNIQQTTLVELVRYDHFNTPVG